MIDLHDMYVIEGDEDVSDVEYYKTIQKAINTGLWGLQGSYGRTMMDAIKGGYCLLGKKSVTDYYGNHVPSRTDVVNGTVGSFDFVAKECGEGWAITMSEVE